MRGRFIRAARYQKRKLGTHGAAGLGEAWIYIWPYVFTALGPRVDLHAGTPHVYAVDGIRIFRMSHMFPVS